MIQNISWGKKSVFKDGPVLIPDENFWLYYITSDVIGHHTGNLFNFTIQWLIMKAFSFLGHNSETSPRLETIVNKFA